jgi:site-specific DNA recombinase
LSENIITIGYVRVSTDMQLDGFSINNQIREIKKYCEANNFPEPIIYDEGSGSGSSIEERHEFQKMMRDVLTIYNNIKVYLIVWKVDRFARNLLEGMHSINLLTKNNHVFVSVGETLTTENPSAIMLLQTFFTWAENQRHNILQVCKSGMKQRAIEGFWNGGKVFGYKSNSEKSLDIVDNEAKIVRFIFERYIHDQWGYSKIAKFLNTQYTESQSDRIWDKQAIRTIVTNPVYAGYIRWGKKGGEEIINKGKHPAIITEEEWIQAKLQHQDMSYKPIKIHKGNYFLSGLLKCPDCGSSMVQHKSAKGGKYLYYQCSKNKNNSMCKSNLINKFVAEEYVLSQLSVKVKSPHLQELLTRKFSSQLKNDLTPKKEQIKSFKKDLKKITKRKNELFDLEEKKVISKESLGEQISRLEEKEQLLKRNLQLLNTKVSLDNSSTVKKIVQEITNNFQDFFNNLSDTKQKELLREFIGRIDIKEVSIGKKRPKRKIDSILYYFEIEDLSALIA